MNNVEGKAVAYKDVLETTKVTQFLEDLVTGLKTGKVSVQHGTQSLIMQPAERVQFTVKAKQKPWSESIEIELKWAPGQLTELRPCQSSAR